MIDNILAVCDNFIKADGQVDFLERSSFLQKHTKQLKRLAVDYNMVIVVLNNVVADLSQGNSNKGQGFFQKGQVVMPALGLMWSNCINERIGLRKKIASGNEVKRVITIDKSAFMRRSDIEFEISAQGIRGRH